MKTRIKVIIVILLAIVCFELTQKYGAPAKIGSIGNLDAIYNSLNVQYFGNSLPKDTVVDWSETGSTNMATTYKLQDGRFHIALNEQYLKAERVLALTMLHEQCHIKTFTEAEAGQEHGARWRTCMLELDLQGAFRNQLIDGYDGR